jgi:hypothetical protein
MSPDESKLSPPYVSFKTFLSVLDSLSHGTPTQFDRSVMPSFAGSVQNQVTTALRYLNLIDAKGKTSDRLRILAEDKEQRKAVLKEVLSERYPEVMALDLMRTSPLQLMEVFRSYGPSGDTLEKTIRFFLAAAGYAGIPYSQMLTARKRGPRVKRNGRTVELNNNNEVDLEDLDDENENETDLHPPQRTLGEAITIDLRSGGTLTVSASTSFFKMSSQDRAFVFDIIDRLQQYTAKEATGTAE